MDNRLATFLKLCENMNYRKTAEDLNISQPAVTKQIQSLEEEFVIKLFKYNGKSLERSDQSYLLEKFAISQRSAYVKIKEDLKKEKIPSMNIGMTKTIGEFGVLDYICNYLDRHEVKLNITIDNTEALLDLLKKNKVEFILVEGDFDKGFFDYELLSNEIFTGICNKDHPFSNKEVDIKSIFKERLIIREDGSGSRDILENQLKYKGYSIDDFEKTLTINSINMIEKLIGENKGITFGYDIISKSKPYLSTFNIKGITNWHEFNAISIASSGGLEKAKSFLQA